MTGRILGPRGRIGALVIIAVAAALAIVGGPDRFWPAWLLASITMLTVGLGAAVFVAIHHLTNAAWTAPIRRTAEAIAMLVPFASAMMLASLAGAGTLYEWTHAGAIEHGGATAFKSAWLELPFFAVRMVVVLALWSGFALLLRRESLRQDHASAQRATGRMRVVSAAFLVVLAITITTAGADWLMSLDPHFASTLFGWYLFAGVFSSGIALLAIVVVVQRGRGALGHVGITHLHNLGKMLFAFATFWAYLWYCQYMLIYYTNLPEETAWFARQLAAPGGDVLFWLNPALGWAVPFVVLLARGAKRAPAVLVTGALLVLAGHAVDLAVIILPATVGTAIPGVADVGLLLGALAAGVLVVDGVLTGTPLVPWGDPYLEEGVGHAMGELTHS
jgi:hypothetical protein